MLVFEIIYRKYKSRLHVGNTIITHRKLKLVNSIVKSNVRRLLTINYKATTRLYDSLMGHIWHC